MQVMRGCGKQEDEEAEYEAWKDREMARIARDREEKRREAAEAEERERLKHMTDEERRQWERDHPKARMMISFNDVCIGLTMTSACLRNTGQPMGMLLRLETRKPYHEAGCSIDNAGSELSASISQHLITQIRRAVG